jgi:hypothetical protein
MYCRVVIFLLFTSLAVAQTSPAAKSDLPSAPSESQHHDDDDLPPPPSAAAVSPDSPVITVEGLCDSTSGAAKSSGSAETKAGTRTEAAKKQSSGSSSGVTSPGCKTVVTKAQFEKLVDALNPDMPATVRRQLAESYPRLLLFAGRARELGLDQEPSFPEMMRFASVQLLTQALNRYFQQQAKNISDAEVESYYKENAIKYQRADLIRIFVPAQTRQATKTASEPQSGTAPDSPMKSLADKMRARAVAGEDFQQLQKEAFEAAGIASGSPNVSMGKMAATGLPLNHQKVFELEPGQVSEVIADSSGYYVYKIVSKQLVPLGQARGEIRKSIESQRFRDATAALAKSIHSELNPAYFVTSPGGRQASAQRRAQPADESPAK